MNWGNLGGRAALVAGSAVCATAVAAGAAPAQTVDTERARIVRERDEVRSAFAKQEAACRDRFVVTPCIETARKDEREALARLRRQEVLLDEEARKQRANERTVAIRNNISADEERQRKDAEAQAAASAPPASGAGGAGRSEHSESPAPQERSRREARVPAAPPSAEARLAREQQHIDQVEAERRAIQAHRDSVEARNARRASSGKTAAPLPVPGASAP